ncbi:STAS domain-containing protein [Streptomyces globisporus]|uniref:STAS domain-containing protein n=1 Tax=Streptomyces globisporus TaxID=1908 RepID=UPI0036DB9E86
MTMSHEPRRISVEPSSVISLRGEYDLFNTAPVEAQIDAVIRTHGRVILDVSNVTFADSTFLRVIFGAHQRTDLRIVAPSPKLTRLFELLGVDTLLRIYPTLNAALTA